MANGIAFALVKFATAHNKPTLSHETITWVFLLLIRERMARSARKQTWAEFSSSNQDLLTWKDDILKKYYREETLSSALARSIISACLIGLWPRREPCLPCLRRACLRVCRSQFGERLKLPLNLIRVI